MLSYIALATLIASTLAADPAPRKFQPGPQGPAKQIIFSSGPLPQFPQEIPYNINLLEPQFQYPDFGYVPDKQQPFPRIQPPPVIFYGGAAPPGQQFLYRPGAPPGNFLVPQPQPQPQPGPGVLFGGNPPGPLFVAGYPKPAHIPPIEKDAEEIPTNLAGNHPVAGVGRPVQPSLPTPPASKPEKLETFDEPVSAGEADVLAEADKNPNNIYPNNIYPNNIYPNNIYPRKPLPAPPALKPGQQFFILNGRPLFSNYPLGAAAAPPQNYPGIPQQAPGIYVFGQPQYGPQLPPQHFQVPVQDLFLRNSVTGQISDVKPVPETPSGFGGSLFVDSGNVGNYISLNSADDFRQGYLLRGVGPVPSGPSAPQKVTNLAPKEYELPSLVFRTLSNAKAPADKEPVETRIGKEIEFTGPLATFDRGLTFFDNANFGSQYRYAPLLDSKENDDSVIIDAKVQSDDTPALNSQISAEDPSLSQAQPSATAIAGKGGVASAGPRGTALVGNKGLAVARPHATAVAGPSKEETEKKTKSKKERQ